MPERDEMGKTPPEGSQLDEDLADLVESHFTSLELVELWDEASRLARNQEDRMRKFLRLALGLLVEAKVLHVSVSRADIRAGPGKSVGVPRGIRRYGQQRANPEAVGDSRGRGEPHDGVIPKKPMPLRPEGRPRTIRREGSAPSARGPS